MRNFIKEVTSMYKIMVWVIGMLICVALPPALLIICAVTYYDEISHSNKLEERNHMTPCMQEKFK